MIKHHQNDIVGSASSSSSQNSSHSHSVLVSFVDSRGSITKIISREEEFELTENDNEDVILENCDETVFRPVVTVFSEFDDGVDKVEIKMNENFVQTIHPELVVPVIDEKMMECARKQEATAKQMADKTATSKATVDEKKVVESQPQIIEKVVEVEKVQVSTNYKKNKRAKKYSKSSFGNYNNNFQQQLEMTKPSEEIVQKTESKSEIIEQDEDIHDEIVIVADVGSQEFAEFEMNEDDKHEKYDEIVIITEENLASLDTPTTFDEVEMIEIPDTETPEEIVEIPFKVVNEQEVVEEIEKTAAEENVAMPPPASEPMVEMVENTSLKKARRSKKNKKNTTNSYCNNNIETISDLVVSEPAPPPMTTQTPTTVELDNKPTNDVIDSPIELEIVSNRNSNEQFDNDENEISDEVVEKLTQFYDIEEELEIDLAPLSSFDAHFSDEPQIDDLMMTEQNEISSMKSKISEVVKNTNMIFAMCSSLKDVVEYDEDTKSTSSQSQIQRSTSSSFTTNTTTSTFASANSVQTGEGVESDYKSFEIDADILDEIRVVESEDISSVDATSSETDDASMKRSFENEPKFKVDDDEELRPLLQTSINSLSSPSEVEMKNPAMTAAPTAVNDALVVVSDFPSLEDVNPKSVETPITLTSTMTTNNVVSRNKKNKRKRR